MHNIKLYLEIWQNKMLIEFRVKNFRSFRDEQVLSLVASQDKTLKDTHTVVTDFAAIPHVLRSAVIYGANASGKSNLLKALQYMRRVVIESAAEIKPDQTYPIQPFRLDNESAAQASEFEVTFILDAVRYQYGFTMTSQRIMSEYLLVYKSAKPQRWFERRFDLETGKDIYEYGPGLKGSKALWEGATRPNALFLSMAVQLNSEILRPIFNWFSSKLIIFNEQSQLSPHTSMQMLKDVEGRKRICDFLSSADISISDIELVTQKVPGQSFHFDLAAGKAEVRTEEVEEQQLRFIHRTDDGEAIFDVMDESSGTRNLLSLAGPVLDILRLGLTLVIDELDTSLHTLLVRELVDLFHRPEINTGGAQLIFTTHDTSLLSATGLFRRDQIWFVEKDRNQVSSLVSLAEFSPRSKEAFERGYLTGRYGGVPFLHDSLGLSR